MRKRLTFDVEKKAVDVVNGAFEEPVKKKHKEDVCGKKVEVEKEKHEKHVSQQIDSNFSNDKAGLSDMLLEEDRAEREMEERIRERNEFDFCL